MRCHSINQEGGKIGPDLNAPRSVTAYRSKRMIKEFIRHPSKYRYTQMPDHTDLSDRDLEDLYQYFRFKSNQPEKTWQEPHRFLWHWRRRGQTYLPAKIHTPPTPCPSKWTCPFRWTHGEETLCGPSHRHLLRPWTFSRAENYKCPIFRSKALNFVF